MPVVRKITRWATLALCMGAARSFVPASAPQQRFGLVVSFATLEDTAERVEEKSTKVNAATYNSDDNPRKQGLALMLDDGELCASLSNSFKQRRCSTLAMVLRTRDNFYHVVHPTQSAAAANAPTLKFRHAQVTFFSRKHGLRRRVLQGHRNQVRLCESRYEPVLCIHGHGKFLRRNGEHRRQGS